MTNAIFKHYLVSFKDFDHKPCTTKENVVTFINETKEAYTVYNCNFSITLVSEILGSFDHETEVLEDTISVKVFLENYDNFLV